MGRGARVYRAARVGAGLCEEIGGFGAKCTRLLISQGDDDGAILGMVA
jgi:hypothetical protein